MGQPVTVIEKSSPVPGVVRFEINRSITGMGFERYGSRDDAVDVRPPDELARRLFDHGGVTGVTINSNMITLDLAPGVGRDGFKELIEELFTYYRPGVEVVIPEGAGTD
jgi:hypothetical protein